MATAEMAFNPRAQVFEYFKDKVPATRGAVLKAHINHLGNISAMVSFILVHHLSWDPATQGVLWAPATMFYARLYQLGMDATALSPDALFVARMHLLAAIILWGVGHIKSPAEEKFLEKVTMGKSLVAQFHFFALIATLWGLHMAFYGILGPEGKLAPTGLSFDMFGPITPASMAGNHVAFGAVFFLGGIFHYFAGFNTKKFAFFEKDWEAVLSVSCQVLAFHFATVVFAMIIWQHPQLGFGFMREYAVSQYAGPELKMIAQGNPGLLVKQAILGHLVMGIMFWIGGVFHGAHFMLRVLNDPKMAEEMKDFKFIKRCYDHEFQKKFLALIMFGAFLPIFVAYGIATHNTIADIHAAAKTGIFAHMTYINIGTPLHDAVFGSKGSISEFVAAHAIAGGLHFTMVPMWRMVFFSKVSPWTTKVGMKAKRDGEFPCLGPAYGGTCSISLVDQFYLAIFFSLQVIAPAWFYIDGCWMGSFVAVAQPNNEIYQAALAAYNAHNPLHQLSPLTNMGYFSYIIQQTTAMFSRYDGHMIQALLGAHFIWAFTFSMLFQYRGSRDEGSMVLKWAHEQVGVGFAGKVYNRALSLKEGKAIGTFLFFKMTIVCMWCLAMV
ncbi:hypothetical protein GTO89_07035 [Heliobacterium gestii]|uniref:p800 reaction center core protein n=1 Tax=Heliomicrobium gestii TaxID=2699 RepID=Q1MX23_HELGE|nr:hypothetical protein [Heliomicrobium gestii]MBM7866421.1 hypothetical protein [Heliomicrobium gestii]MZP42795.1 hypothetical protein [Heliomicrobium gestii]BAE93764.1 P800 reaction center core protein [Heliomicrobium gestii]